MKKKSRYIKAEVIKLVNKASNFKCAWCGIDLTERHHLEPFAL